MKSISALELKLKDFETIHSILKTKHETLQAGHTALDQSNMALVANIASAKLAFSKAWAKLGLSKPPCYLLFIEPTSPCRRARKEGQGQDPGESRQH